MLERSLRILLLRLRSLVRRKRVEEELDEEIRYHLERQIEELTRNGLPFEEARKAALRRFAAVDQRKEECRDARGVTALENILRDTRYAVRGLVKNPAFTLAAILTFSLAIGANTAVFTMVNSVLLRQLPFKNADRLVWIWSTRTDRDKAFYSIQNFLDTRQQATTLDDMAAFANWGANLTGSGEPVRLTGVRISANAFEMLGVDAAAGRLLQASDGTPDAARVVVISNGIWRTRYAGEQVLGRSLLLNGSSYTIVGVLPPEFNLPNAEIEIAAPLVFETDPQRSDRGSNFLRTFARLKPGITVNQAREELGAITEQLKQQYPDQNAKHTPPRVLTLLDEIVGSYHTLLWTLLAAVAIVLLVASTNLAHMMLVRSTARRKEFAIRAALGGSRAQLARELTITSLLLSTAGGALGVLFAAWGVRLLVLVGPADLPRVKEIGLDWRVLAFTACMSLLVGLVFGLTPAIRAARVDVNDALKGGGRSTNEGTHAVAARGVLVVSEVALSVLLLVGAGLLVRSFTKLQSVSAGIDPHNVLTIRLSLPASKYSEPEVMTAFVDRLVESTGNVRGVRSASLGSVLPMSGMNTRADFTVAARPPAKEEERPAAQNRWVMPGYFRTLGIPLLRGRDFTDFDNRRSQQVVIIDEALAQRYFANENPIGMQLRVDDAGPNTREVEVVGVVGSVKHFSLNDPPTPTYYSPLAQVPLPALGFLLNGMSLIVKTETEPLEFSERLRHEIQSLDPDVPASAARTMNDFLATSIAPRRFNLLLIELFASTALVLAAMGLYSVIAYTVAQRRHEIGIRMALGASSHDVFRTVLRDGMRLALAGEAAGLIGALATTRLLSGLLFDVTPTDPLTFATISVMLAATAFIACYVPARRATTIDPTIALRNG